MARLAPVRATFSPTVVVPLSLAIVFIAADLILGVACLVAYRQNAALRGNLAVAVDAVTPVKYQNAPSLTGMDQHGNQVEFSYHQDHRPTVVFTFSDECGYCPAYWKVIKGFQSLPPQKLRLVYIDTMDGPYVRPDYLAANGVDGAPVLIRLSTLSTLHYGSRVLPLVELLDRNGRVEWTHAGDLASGDAKELVSQIDRYVRSE